MKNRIIALKANLPNWKKIAVWTLFIPLCLLSSCRTAEYEIVGEEQVLSTEPTVPPCEDCKIEIEPTADLEVLDQKSLVTAVVTNKEVTIRATDDTFDPDDLGLEGACPVNAGIVTAKYAIQGQEIPIKVERSACESLAIKHTFTVPGSYIIELEVTSNEDEHALASMTLIVYEPSQQSAPKGFDIEARPIMVVVGDPIEFGSNCETDHKLETQWSLGDGNASKGQVLSYTYELPGPYEVNATCGAMEASLTVVILPKDHSVAVDKAPLKKPIAPPSPNPGQQTPGQQTPGQQTPGQQTPGQNSPIQQKP
jgi:PKD repeat protein